MKKGKVPVITIGIGMADMKKGKKKTKNAKTDFGKGIY